MPVTTQHLHHWLTQRYHDYDVAAQPIHGTYGLIWMLTVREPKRSPGGFAVKTVAPEAISISGVPNDADYLRREFRMWLALPPTQNVLSAIGFDVATLIDDASQAQISLPVMRMSRMLGSLQDWVGSERRSLEEKLVALAQTFNGLLYLYNSGFEGHGDLKPSNILYDDLTKFSIPEDGPWPSKRIPWRIRVADLGWADAWVDLGFTNKARREYLAPERLDGVVVPRQSDVFSMGAVMAEVMQGRHPCGNLKKALGSIDKWKRWIENGERDLSGVVAGRTRDVILGCLRPAPEARPPPEYCLQEICAEVRERYGYDIGPTLELWRQPAAGNSEFLKDEHRGWAAGESVRLGADQEAQSRADIAKRLGTIKVSDVASCEHWVVLAEGLYRILEANSVERGMELRGLRQEARAHLQGLLGAMTLESLGRIDAREDLPKAVRPFERLSEVVVRVSRIAGLKYEEMMDRQFGLGPLSKSALAFGYASEVRGSGTDDEVVEKYVEQAIAFAPDVAVPYYYRALWRHGRAAMAAVIAKEGTSDADTKRWVGDLEMACACDPHWEEPRQLLERIRASPSKS